MKLRKTIGFLSLGLVAVMVSACDSTSNMRTAEYYGVPYCCDRTAPPGVAMYHSQPVPQQRVAEAPPTRVTEIEPAAGDEVFYNAIQK